MSERRVRTHHSIIFKLALSFASIILLLVLNNLFVYIDTKKIKLDFNELTNEAIPLLSQLSKIRLAILDSNIALNQQIIVGDDEILRNQTIETRRRDWNNIEGLIKALKVRAVGMGYSESRIDAINQLLSELKLKQSYISDVANTIDNEPAVALLQKEAIPVAEHMILLLTQLIELESGNDASEDSKYLLKLLSDSRSSFATAISELRAFMLTKERNRIDAFDQLWFKNTDAFEEIIDDYEDSFSEQQLPLWQDYQSSREKLAPITIRAFSLQSSEKNNIAQYELREFVFPLSKEIMLKLDDLSEFIDNSSRDAIETVNSSVSQLIFILSGLTILVIVVSILISANFSSKLRKRIISVLKRTSRLSSGDFREMQEYRKQTNAIDELDLLDSDFNRMADSLCEALSNIKGQFETVHASTEGVTQLAKEITDSSDNENRSYNEVISVSNDFKSKLNETDDVIQSSQKTLKLTKNEANQAIQSVSDSLGEMQNTVDVVQQAAIVVNELKVENEKISQVTEAIHTVADQTSLIALNAAIEAARAGEYGRGFSVVADEVRNLAARTSASTGEISNVVSGLSGKVDSVIKLMDQVLSLVDSNKSRAEQNNQQLEQMTSSVDSILDANQEISVRSEAQVSQMDELIKKLDELFQSLNNNSNKASQVSNICSELQETTTQVNKKMEQFSFND